MKTAGRLDGKVAIVTGAADGIGYACVARLAGAGARVLITGTRLEPLEQAAGRLRRKGADVATAPMDLADERSIVALAHEAIRRFGRIDVLHNNAADLSVTDRDLDIETMDVAVWDRIFG